MSGVLRLGNTGAGTGRSTLEASASNDQTFTLPSAGGTILTTDFDTIGDITWNGSNINITNADLNVNSGQLFVDESTGLVSIATRLGINKTDPELSLDIFGPDTTTSSGLGDVKGQLRIFNNTTALGSSPRAGLVFSTKYRSSPDIPLDGAAIYGGKENTGDANKDFFLAFATRSESPNEATEKLRITSDGLLLSGVSSTNVGNRAIFQGNNTGSTVGVVTIANDGDTITDDSLISVLDFSDNSHLRSARIAAIADNTTWDSGVSQPSRLSFFVTADGNNTPGEYARISENYGMTGGIVERFFRCEAKYFNGTTTVDSPGFFLSRSQVPSISTTGARIYFTFPTCWQHRKVIEARLIYGVNGNASGNPWTVNGTMYRASSGQGYTTDGVSFSFDLTASAFNGKIYTTLIPTFPTLQREHINSLELEFTENVNGSTVGVFGLQLIESTRAV